MFGGNCAAERFRIEVGPEALNVVVLELKDAYALVPHVVALHARAGTRPLDRGAAVLGDHIVKPGAIGRPVLARPVPTDERVARDSVADVTLFAEERDDVIDVSVTFQGIERVHKSARNV